MSQPLHINDNLTIPAAELSWAASRSSGSGGQNVNKVASKVALRFDLPGTAVLDEAAKARLRGLSGVRLDAAGWVLVISQLTRDQVRNLEDARQKLSELVLAALRPPRARRPTKPGRSARERRMQDKRRNAERKRQRVALD